MTRCRIASVCTTVTIRPSRSTAVVEQIAHYPRRLSARLCSQSSSIPGFGAWPFAPVTKTSFWRLDFYHLLHPQRTSVVAQPRHQRVKGTRDARCGKRGQGRSTTALRSRKTLDFRQQKTSYIPRTSSPLLVGTTHLKG